MFGLGIHRDGLPRVPFCPRGSTASEPTFVKPVERDVKKESLEIDKSLIIPSIPFQDFLGQERVRNLV